MRIVQHISQTVFQENTYVLYKNDRVLVIDPGDAPGNYADLLRKDSNVAAVLATHTHLDHVLSAAHLCKNYECPFVCSARDQEILDALKLTCDRYNMPYFGTPVIDKDISEIQHFEIEGFSIDVFHTPGHTPGSVCYLIDGVLFSGDTLFHRSVGRTDLPGGDHATLIRSIRTLFNKVPDETMVYPGHMNSTTIGDEKKFNPFIVL